MSERLSSDEFEQILRDAPCRVAGDEASAEEELIAAWGRLQEQPNCGHTPPMGE